MKYKAVFFDAGETLVHPHPSFPELFAEVLRGNGYEIEPEQVSRRIAVISERFGQVLDRKEPWSTSRERSEAFWLSVYRLFLEGIGVPSGNGLEVELYRAFSDHANYRLFDDAQAVLIRLHDARVTLGVISNFEDWLEVLLERLDVTRYLPVRVISGVEGIEKPDRRIFELALQRAGAAPEDSIYVGDNPVFDVEPAAATGMFPVLIDRYGRHPDHPGSRIRSLEELPALVGL